MAPATEPGPELAAFERAVGTTFAVRIESGAEATLTLLEVTNKPAPEGWERFSLLFAGPERPPERDGGPERPPERDGGPDPVPFDLGTFTVHHDEIGTFPLAVGPVQVLGAGPCYEAVFTRPAPNRVTN